MGKSQQRKNKEKPSCFYLYLSPPAKAVTYEFLLALYYKTPLLGLPRVPLRSMVLIHKQRRKLNRTTLTPAQRRTRREGSAGSLC